MENNKNQKLVNELSKYLVNGLLPEDKELNNIPNSIHIDVKKSDSLDDKINPQDVIKTDVPLFIRLLEYAREDAKTDMDLHDVAENIIKLSANDNILGMKEYDQIVPKSTLNENQNSNYNKYIKYLNELLDDCCNELKIKHPELEIINDEKYTQENFSFGGYQPGANKIYLVIKNRVCSDSCRTLTHEIYHAYQDSQGVLTTESGKDGSEHENEANSFSGKTMRTYNKKYPEILTLRND